MEQERLPLLLGAKEDHVMVNALCLDSGCAHERAHLFFGTTGLRTRDASDTGVIFC